MRERLWLAALLLGSAGLFFTALDWGLPTRDADRYLFGDRTPWTGEQVLALAGGWSDRGDLPSDLDADPLDRSAGPVVLNGTDAERAAIVLRYRLYSYQPDEMHTFRALASMRPGSLDLDPRFYLYGGLWVYPVGGLLKAASLAGWVTLRSDLPYYLDHPEAFGRFYVVARAYSAAWGVAGVWVCYLLGRRLGGSSSAGLLAGLLFALLPVTVNAAHEAKPHLAGAVLSLAAVLPAGRHASTGRRRWAVLTGVLCGAAAGVVLSGASAFVIVVAMAGLRASRQRTSPELLRVVPTPASERSEDPDRSPDDADCSGERPGSSLRSDAGVGWGVSLMLSVAAGATVYALTNPYVVLNLLRGRSVVGENVGHLQTFYWPTLAGVPNAMGLLLAAIGPALALAGAAGAVALAVRPFVKGDVSRERSERSGPAGAAGPERSLRSRLTAELLDADAVAPTALPLAALAAATLAPFLLLADGKTADYGRFALVPAACLAVFAASAWGRLRSTDGWPGSCDPAGRRATTPAALRPAGSQRPRALQRLVDVAAVAVVLLALPPAGRYWLAFHADAGRPTSRTVAAGLIADQPGETLVVTAEPAPYALPPIDLWRWRIELDGRRAFAPARPPAAGDDELHVAAVDRLRPAWYDGDTTRLWPGRWRDRWFAAPIAWADKPFLIVRPAPPLPGEPFGR